LQVGSATAAPKGGPVRNKRIYSHTFFSAEILAAAAERSGENSSAKKNEAAWYLSTSTGFSQLHYDKVGQ
jgi:hypothetical protein